MQTTLKWMRQKDDSMPESQIPVEFVGGPMDGIKMVLRDEPEKFAISVFNGASATVHTYRRRRIKEIAVRMPSGLFPFDWVDPHAST